MSSKVPVLTYAPYLFGFLLPGTEWHSNLLGSFGNAKSQTGSKVRRCWLAPNMQFKIVHDSKGENVKYVHQNKVFYLFVKSQLQNSNSPWPCCCTLYPKIILFLVCSFHLCPSPLWSILCNMWKALRYRRLKLTACVLKLYCTCVC